MYCFLIYFSLEGFILPVLHDGYCGFIVNLWGRSLRRNVAKPALTAGISKRLLSAVMQDSKGWPWPVWVWLLETTAACDWPWISDWLSQFQCFSSWKSVFLHCCGIWVWLGKSESTIRPRKETAAFLPTSSSYNTVNKASPPISLLHIS